MLARSIIISILLFYSFNLFGQTEYGKYVEEKRLNQRQIEKFEGAVYEVIYIGAFKDQQHIVKYHILSVFRNVQAAIEMHGHTEVIFLDKNLKLIKQIELALPEELPFKLEENKLHFHYTDDNSHIQKVFEFDLDGKIPESLCVSPSVCY